MKKQALVPEDSRYVPLTQQKSCCAPTCIQMVMLRHGLPLLPAEEIGYHLGLIVPSERGHLFYKPRISEEKPPTGFGTRIHNPRFNPARAFKKLGLPMSLEIKPITDFDSSKEALDYLINGELEDKDILICFNHGVLIGDSSKNWGHVCVFDRVIGKKIRIIDPSQNQPKWRRVSIEKLFQAITEHLEKPSAGFWEIEVVRTC